MKKFNEWLKNKPSIEKVEESWRNFIPQSLGGYAQKRNNQEEQERAKESMSRLNEWIKHRLGYMSEEIDRVKNVYNKIKDNFLNFNQNDLNQLKEVEKMIEMIHNYYQNELQGKNQELNVGWNSRALPKDDRSVYVYAWDEEQGRLAKYGEVKVNEPLRKMGKMQDKLYEVLKDSSPRLSDWYGSHNVEYMLKNIGEDVKNLWSENQKIKERIDNHISRKAQEKSDDFYRRSSDAMKNPRSSGRVIGLDY